MRHTLALALRDLCFVSLYQNNLDLTCFTLALEQWALTYAAVGILRWESGMAHRHHCLQASVAGTACRFRTHALGQIYDELCQHDWAERARRCEPNFDPSVAALSWNQDIFRQAEIEFDRRGIGTLFVNTLPSLILASFCCFVRQLWGQATQSRQQQSRRSQFSPQRLGQ